MDRLRFAVVPTNGRDCLEACVEAIRPQVDFTVLIYTIPYNGREVFSKGVVLRDLREPNISRWWNMGLTWAQGAHDRTQHPAPNWDVAILNDDVIVPAGWFEAVASKMREMRAAAGCSGGLAAYSTLHTHIGPVPLHARMQGFAFIVAGEKGLRANEDLAWYFSDDYMDWESRKLGGMVQIPDYHVNHLFPNAQMTNELAIANAAGAAKFHELYEGVMPW